MSTTCARCPGTHSAERARCLAPGTTTGEIGTVLPELEAGEVTGFSPTVKVLEVGSGTSRVPEEPIDAARLTFVVVVAGSAVRRADNAQHRSGEQQLHPGVLRFLGDLDLTTTAVEGVPDNRREGLGRLGEVVRHVCHKIGSLGDLHHEGVGEAVYMDAVHGPHALGPSGGQREAVAAAHIKAGPSREWCAHLETRGVDDAVDLVLNVC